MLLRAVDWRKSLTPPNVITFVRVILFWMPAFALLNYRGWLGLQLALISFAALSLTDMLDGWLARRDSGRWKTKLGAMMDAVADKLLFTSYMIALCIRHWGHWPIFVVLSLLIAREIWLSIAQAYHGWLCNRYVETNMAGKVKTALLCLVGLTLSIPYSLAWWYQTIIWGLLLVTTYSDVLSTIGYARSFKMIRQELGDCNMAWQDQPTYLKQLMAGGWRLPASSFTLLRAAMSFWAMLILIITHGSATWRIVAAVIIALAAVTDFLDGFVARRTGTTSKLGKWMDPMTDKFFIGFTFIGLTFINHSLIWITYLIILREVIVVYMQAEIEGKRGERVSSSWWGKSKMFLQCVAAILLCLPYPVANTLGLAIVIVSLVLAYMSGAEYLHAFLRVPQT